HGRFLQLATNALSDSFFYGAPVYLQLDEFHEVKASVLQVTRSPGKKIVYLGCVLLVAGTLVTPPDWALLCQALDQQGDEAALRARTVSCAELSACAPDAQQMARALRVALTQTLGEEAGDGAGEAADDSARQAPAPNRP
uniref:cytochrome c biogenesis protein ResB n=1 Tax=Diaphorobacter sp. TaxID=1934310 RepID=UPI00289E2E65